MESLNGKEKEREIKINGGVANIQFCKKKNVTLYPIKGLIRKFIKADLLFNIHLLFKSRSLPSLPF